MNGWRANVKSLAISKLKSPTKAPSIKTVLGLLRKKFPNAQCELFYETPYHLLTSVVLSAQTTDVSVNKVMTPLYKAGFTPEIMVSWGSENFLKKIKSIGLAPTKSKNVFKLSQILIEKHNSQVPGTREELEALPGVGRKTANVILGELFGQPTLAVDTHVFRVTKRLGWHQEKTPEKCEQALLKIVKPAHLPEAHHLFIHLGRYICKARKPECESCPLESKCPQIINP